MTTVFLLLSDVRVVLFMLASNRLHIAAVYHKHMTRHISRTQPDLNIDRVFMHLQLWILDARLQIYVQFYNFHNLQILPCFFCFLQTFWGDKINHQMTPFRKTTPNIQW